MLKSCMNKKGKKAKTKCICANIRESIADENMAGYKDYPKLSKQLKRMGWEGDIMGLSYDERRHKRELKKIYERRCR